MRPCLRSRFAPLLVLVLALAGQGARADTLAEMPPLGPGPFPVACSNLEQDFTRLAPGEDVQAIWEGVPQDGRARFITDLLTDPSHALVLDIAVPDERTLYGDYAGRRLASVALVCYPTSAANTRASYALPNGRAIPHMQRGAEAPLWPDANARYPLLLFATGLGGSPLSQNYLSALAVFASHGYVVVAPFFGDARIADIRLEDFADLVDALLNFRAFVAMQSLRAVELSVALDAVLAHPDYRDRIDTARIGGFGASLGAESLLLTTGALLTTSIGQSSTRVLTDSRVKAVVGYVPYFGQPFYPAFGRDQSGLSGIDVPFLGIAGTADTTAPLPAIEQGVARLRGTRELVTLEGVQHGFDRAFTDDIFTWALVFLAAHVQQDPLARARIARMQRVAGGGDDRTRIDYTAPSVARGDEREVVEYFRAANGHYFVTAEPAEIAMLDAGVVVPGWTRTGFAFKSWATQSGRGVAACRFFGTPGIGPDSHFYTIDADECAKVRATPAWTYEGLAFDAEPLASADCPADRVPVVRLYNNGQGGQANHRYLTSRSEIEAMTAHGWIVEGPVFCALP